LVRKFSWKDEEVLAILTEYTSDGKHVGVTGAVHGVCRDPKDDMVFECAVKADAEIIISGDNDLLSVKTYRGIQILTARQYLDRFSTPPA
jgi:putative PIN family toxin of toxin-antitoxin system